jgi:fumarate hydratase class I
MKSTLFPDSVSDRARSSATVLLPSFGTEACKKHGGFYLGTIGGVAAVLSQSSIKSIECVEYPELGMEAIWKITVEDFPAFILVDDKGNDFFKQLKPWTPCKECQK